MRVIAGSLGGRQFEAPAGHRTHPMSEKARGAIFNMLGDIEGLTVLDAFAGSGALSFEAISRGAKNAVAIDIDNGAITTVVKSISDLGLKKSVKAIRAGVSSWSDNNPDTSFDIVLADPPFEKLQIKSVEHLVEHVNGDGVLVLSWPGALKAPEFMGLTMVAQKTYGDNQLVFYKKTG